MEAHVIIVLAILIFAYLVMGGLLFQQVEHKDRARKSHAALDIDLSKEFEALIASDLNLTASGDSKRCRDVHATATNIEAIAQKIADLILPVVAVKGRNGSHDYILELGENRLLLKNRFSRFSEWDFFGSLFFAATTITTIGYGNLAPKSPFGKLVTVIYALIGIPLVAAFLAGLSDKIRELSEKLQKQVQIDQLAKHAPRGHCSFCCVAVIKISVVFFTGASIFIVLPSWLFMWKEKQWSFFEGFYFSFITLTTVGFGDYIAAQNPETEGLEWYRMVIVVWIFVGLAWLSSVIGLIQGTITTYSALAVQQYMKSLNPQGNVTLSRDAIDTPPATSENALLTGIEEQNIMLVSSMPKKTPQKQSLSEYDFNPHCKTSPAEARSTNFTIESEAGEIPDEFNSLPRSQRARDAHRPAMKQRFNLNASPMAQQVSPQMITSRSLTAGLPPMAAAVTSSPRGETYTVVGTPFQMLPQMLQMAIAASESAGDYWQHQKTPKRERPQTPVTGTATLGRWGRIRSYEEATSHSEDEAAEETVEPVVMTPKRPGRIFKGKKQAETYRKVRPRPEGAVAALVSQLVPTPESVFGKDRLGKMKKKRKSVDAESL